MSDQLTKKIKVLTLGWEFPPLINGGLGVACYGLCKALAPLVSLEVMVPKSDPKASYDGFGLVGLNNLRIDQVQTEEQKNRFSAFKSLTEIPLSLDPYSIEAPEFDRNPTLAEEWRTFFIETRAQLEAFKMDDLYGEDTGVKVVEFSKVLVKLAHGMDFDVIHAHDWMTYLAGVEIKKATGKPLVLHLHASQYDRAGANARGWIYDLEKYGMDHCDRVIPVSYYTGTIVRDHYGIPEEKIKPIHNGADEVKTFHTKKKFPEKLVLFLGRLTAQKGPEFFLEIAAKVLEENKNVRFVMAGSGEKLQQLVESGAFKGLGGRFHFTGFLNKDQVNDLLSMTDVYCMPSVSEPFGLSALEAVQFRIPAVISKQSGAAEVLKGALKADFWDTNLMAKHINDLLTDDVLRKNVIEQSERDIRDATWDSAAEKVNEIYKELVQ